MTVAAGRFLHRIPHHLSSELPHCHHQPSAVFAEECPMFAVVMLAQNHWYRRGPLCEIDRSLSISISFAPEGFQGLSPNGSASRPQPKAWASLRARQEAVV